MRVIKISMLIMFYLLSVSLIQAEDVAYFKKMYRQARNLKEKRDKVKEIYNAADDSFKSLVIEIIDEQINYGVERNRSQQRDYEEWVYYAVISAGKLRISEVAPKMKTLFTYLKNSLMRGSVIHSIGMTKNEQMLPWLNLLLVDLNDQHRIGNIRGNEELVIGTLRALAEYNSPTSFAGVFYAAMPNYPDNIRKQAEELLLALTDDPAKYVHTVINYVTDYNLINQALEFIYQSKSSNEGKANTCLMAMQMVLSTEGLKNVTNSNMLQQILDNAVFYLGELKASDPKVVSEIKRKWNFDVRIKNKLNENMHSILKNIEALVSIATDEANLALTEQLKFFNDKISEGSVTGYGEKDGGTILFAIIDGLGTIGSSNSETFFELRRVSTSKEYGEPHKRRAAEAIEKLKK